MKTNKIHLFSLIFMSMSGLILTSIPVIAQNQIASNFMTNNEINAISDELKSEIEVIFLNPPPVAYTPIEFGPGWAEAIWGGPTYPTYHIQWGHRFL